MSPNPNPNLEEIIYSVQRSVPPKRHVDIEAMRILYPEQTRSLKRARDSGDAAILLREIQKAVYTWEHVVGVWPDDWSRWQAAINDVLPLSMQIDIADVCPCKVGYVNVDVE